MVRLLLLGSKALLNFSFKLLLLLPGQEEATNVVHCSEDRLHVTLLEERIVLALKLLS